MKMKKVAAVLACAAMLTVGLTGCGSAKEAAFTSKAGIVITATEQWKQLQTPEEIQELYTEQTTEALADRVDLALKKGGKMYCTIETADVAQDIAQLQEIADQLKAIAAQQGPEEAQRLLDERFDAEEGALYAQLLNDDVDLDLLYQQFSNRAWFAQMAERMKDYTFVGDEETTILGKAATLSEYSYANAGDTKLHFYEASIVQDGVLYTLNSWCDDAAFAENGETLKNIVTTATWSQQ